MEEYRQKLRRMCHDRLKERKKEQYKENLIHRMKYNNPMFDPEVVKKVSDKLKGNQNARKVHRKGVGKARKVRKMARGSLETGQGTKKKENS